MYSVGTSTAWASSSGERFISRRRRRSSSPTVTGSLDGGDDVMNKASWQLGGTELTGVIGRGGAQLCGPCRLAAHSYQSNQEDSELRGGGTGGGVVSRPPMPGIPRSCYTSSPDRRQPLHGRRAVRTAPPGIFGTRVPIHRRRDCPEGRHGTARARGRLHD